MHRGRTVGRRTRKMPWDSRSGDQGDVSTSQGLPAKPEAKRKAWNGFSLRAFRGDLGSATPRLASGL